MLGANERGGTTYMFALHSGLDAAPTLVLSIITYWLNTACLVSHIGLACIERRVPTISHTEK